MIEEKPRTHRKQDDKYFEGLTEEKALSKREIELKKNYDIMFKRYERALEERKIKEANRVERLKEEFVLNKVAKADKYSISALTIHEIIDKIMGDLK